jgi:hypothetical protein
MFRTEKPNGIYRQDSTSQRDPLVNLHDIDTSEPGGEGCGGQRFGISSSLPPKNITVLIT